MKVVKRAFTGILILASLKENVELYEQQLDDLYDSFGVSVVNDNVLKLERAGLIIRNSTTSIDVSLTDVGAKLLEEIDM